MSAQSPHMQGTEQDGVRHCCSVARQVTTSVGLIMAMAGVMAFACIGLLLRLDRINDRLLRGGLPSVIQAGAIRTESARIATLLARLPGSAGALAGQRIAEIEGAETEEGRIADAFTPSLSEAGRPVFAEVARQRQERREAEKPLFAAVRSGRRGEAESLYHDRIEAIDAALAAALDRLCALQIGQVEDQVRASRGALRQAPWFVFLFGGACTVVCLVGAYFLVARLSRSLRGISDHLSRSAAGVQSAGGEMSRTSQRQAAGASEQAASLEEVSAALEQLSGMTRANAGHIEEAQALSHETNEAAQAGRGRVAELLQAMRALKEASDSVGKIIKGVDEIAFQTNILALNAAVEAARAGEAGVGFAVVADEVRNLAQRAAAASRETAASIENSIERSRAGVRLSDSVAEQLQGIAERATRMDELVRSISGAIQEQSRGIATASQSVSEIDKVTQASAAGAQQTAAAAQELEADAQRLHAQMAALGQLAGGEGRGAVPADAPSRLRAPAPASLVRPSQERHLSAVST